MGRGAVLTVVAAEDIDVCMDDINLNKPFECRILNFKTNFSGFDWSGVVDFLPGYGVGKIDLTSYDATNSSYYDFREALSKKYGQGTERAFDDRQDRCRDLITRWNSRQGIIKLEWGVKKGIQYEIKGDGAKIVLQWVESSLCPNTPGEVLDHFSKAFRRALETNALELVYLKVDSVKPDEL
jgi:hypothetical protein